MADLMTKADIHDFGVEVVVGYLQRERHEIIAVNTDMAVNPQIVAKNDGQLEFVVVRTECYPRKGALEPNVRIKCIAHADSSGAICFFASVGISNASSTNEAEMALPIKGAGYHVAFNGIELMSNTVSDDQANEPMKLRSDSRQNGALAALNELSATTDILLRALSSSDADKSHEAISIMLMQGVDFFGPQSIQMQQFFPVWDAIRSNIDRSNLQLALSQATTWKTQLHEVIALVRQAQS